VSFLTPEFFDAMVVIVIVVGLIAAANRIYRDFRRGLRWPEKPVSNEQPTESEGGADHA
jgi:hypothetical protein